MQLNLTTDYAIRCMLHLAQMPKGDSAQGTADAAGISRPHAQKILRQLREGKLVTSTLGSAGGFALARPASEITLYDIIIVMELTVFVNRCLEEDHYCSLCRAKFCPVRKVYEDLQNCVEHHMRSRTLASLIEEELAGSK